MPGRNVGHPFRSEATYISTPLGWRNGYLFHPLPFFPT
jgi:hypothetical protein